MMINNDDTTTHPRRNRQGPGEHYRSGEGLRTVLNRLHDAGAGAWEHDPVAAELMGFVAEKYAALARKHGLDRWEAASAAFDVMRTKAARTADDPWAVITHGVRITCIAEERAQGLLCSVNRARRPNYSVFHDAERLSDRDTPLSEYHPAFRIPAPDVDDDTDDETPAEFTPEGVCMSASSAVEEAIALFTRLHWPPATARAGIEHVAQALALAGSRQAAFEALRRDRHARALLDMDRTAWMTLLRSILGTQTPGSQATSAGRGILLRLLIGETQDVLLRDDDLVLAIVLAAPGGDRS